MLFDSTDIVRQNCLTVEWLLDKPDVMECLVLMLNTASFVSINDLYAPRCPPKSTPSSKSHFQAQTVKNLSNCNSRACWPREARIDVSEP